MRPGVTGAAILIALGLLFLLWNTGVFSPGDIGQFFGNLGASIGTFFGNLGGAIGDFFGGLGRAAGQLWPLALIIAGALLLLRRRPAPENPTRDEE